jgi:hypothetical protein
VKVGLKSGLVKLNPARALLKKFELVVPLTSWVEVALLVSVIDPVIWPLIVRSMDVIVAVNGIVDVSSLLHVSEALANSVGALIVVQVPAIEFALAKPQTATARIDAERILRSVVISYCLPLDIPICLLLLLLQGCT